MSQNDAAILLGAFTTLCLPFVYSWAKSNVLPDWVKFVSVLITCILGGFLTAYASGQLVNSQSIIENAAKIVAAGSAIYVGVFRVLNLERVIFPRASLISEAEKSVAKQIGMLSTETVNDAVDPTCDTSLHVKVDKIDVGSSKGILPG